MDVKNATQSGAVLALRRLLREEPSRANELFEGLLPKGAEIALVDALIEAGADVDFQQAGEDGRKGDTPLIGAASLGAEDAGIKP